MSKHKFQPGHAKVTNSGVQKGYKSPISYAAFSELLKSSGHVDRAIVRLAELMQSRSPGVAYKACELTLAYAFGKPSQTIEMKNKDDKPFQVEMKIDLEKATTDELVKYLQNKTTTTNFTA